MIREYDYEMTQDEALSVCRDVLTSLDYEIGEFDIKDRYIVTEIVTKRFFLKKVDYLVFVNVVDRVRVVLYAEERKFRRFSEWGVSRDNLTELEPSDRLSLSIQDRIYEQLTEALAKRKITYRHPENADLEDEATIYKGINRERRREELSLEKVRKEQAAEENRERRDYSIERDKARLYAADVAENHLCFFNKEGNGDRIKTSLVTASRSLEERDDLLRERMKLLLADYPNYEGSLLVDWILDHEGRVRSVSVKTETTPSTPDVDLNRVVRNHMREIVFPPLTKTGFVRLRRKIEYVGHRHRFTAEMSPPYLIEILQSFPYKTEDMTKDVLFE